MAITQGPINAETLLDMSVKFPAPASIYRAGMRTMQYITTEFSAVKEAFDTLRTQSPEGWSDAEEKLLAKMVVLDRRALLLKSKMIPDAITEEKTRARMKRRFEVLQTNVNNKRKRGLQGREEVAVPQRRQQALQVINLSKEVHQVTREMQRKKIREMCLGVKTAMATAQENAFKEEALVNEVKVQYQALKDKMEKAKGDIREVLNEEMAEINQALEDILQGLGDELKQYDLTSRVEKITKIIEEESDLRKLTDLVQKLRVVVNRMSHLGDIVELLYLNNVFKDKDRREQLMTPFNSQRGKLIPLSEKLHEKIQDHIKENYHIEPQGGDGNCLFRSISTLTTGKDVHYKEIREEVVDHMKEHRERFDPIIKDIIFDEFQAGGHYARGNPRLRHIKSPEQYLKHMAKNQVYGDRPEVQAAADIIGTPILICKLVGGKPSLMEPYYPETPKEGTTPIILKLGDHQHYDAFVEGPPPQPAVHSYPTRARSAQYTFGNSYYGGKDYERYRKMRAAYCAGDAQEREKMVYTAEDFEPVHQGVEDETTVIDISQDLDENMDVADDLD